MLEKITADDQSENRSKRGEQSFVGAAAASASALCIVNHSVQEEIDDQFGMADFASQDRKTLEVSEERRVRAQLCRQFVNHDGMVSS